MKSKTERLPAVITFDADAASAGALASSSLGSEISAAFEAAVRRRKVKPSATFFVREQPGVNSSNQMTTLALVFIETEARAPLGLAVALAGELERRLRVPVRVEGLAPRDGSEVSLVRPAGAHPPA